MAGMAGPQLQIHGHRMSGQDVRAQNTSAVLAVANILKSSLGPVGLDKASKDMVVFVACVAIVCEASARDPCRCCGITC
jgi:hypothetical protein